MIIITKKKLLQKITETIKKKKNLNEILQEKDINKQKDEIHKLIEKIKEISMKQIIENNNNKKLNIVLDLDNTCIFGNIMNYQCALNLKKRYPQKEIKIIKFECNGNIIISALLIRKGLKEFFQFTKNFCNFYINTLANGNYGLAIK